MFLLSLFFLFFTVNEAFGKENSISPKLITFDMFAALMDLYTSLEYNAQIILKGYLNATEVTQFVSLWASYYSGLKDFNSFKQNPNVLFSGDDLFFVMLNSSLTLTITQFQLPLSNDLYNALINSWGNLIPWQYTTETLHALRNAKDANGQPRFQLAVLSNGNEELLKQASSIFSTPSQPFQFDFIFAASSTGWFKPDPHVYAMPVLQGFEQSEILHVAGAAFDAVGAKIYGLNVAWNNLHGAFLENLTGNPSYNPDFNLSDITGLLKILNVSTNQTIFEPKIARNPTPKVFQNLF